MSEADSTETYAGVVSAFGYAIRQSGSRLFRLYAHVGRLVAVVLAFAFTLALVNAVADSLGGGTVSGYPALVLLLGLAVVLPVVGPVLLVARRHRRAAETSARPPPVGYDRLMGGLGFAFLVAAYLAAVISVPASFQSPVEGPLAPVVGALYAAPAVASPVPPAVVVLAMLLLDRYHGRGRGGDPETAA